VLELERSADARMALICGERVEAPAAAKSLFGSDGLI
jgi:hypothetical protein